MHFCYYCPLKIATLKHCHVTHDDVTKISKVMCRRSPYALHTCTSMAIIIKIKACLMATVPSIQTQCFTYGTFSDKKRRRKKFRTKAIAFPLRRSVRKNQYGNPWRIKWCINWQSEVLAWVKWQMGNSEKTTTSRYTNYLPFCWRCGICRLHWRYVHVTEIISTP